MRETDGPDRVHPARVDALSRKVDATADELVERVEEFEAENEALRTRLKRLESEGVSMSRADDVLGERDKQVLDDVNQETDTVEERTETADVVVANAAVPLVANELLPSTEGARLASQFADWEFAPSLTTLYLGFETPPSELGVDHYSTVIQHECVETLADVASVQRESFGRRTLAFVDYSQIEADRALDAKSVGVVTTVDYLGEWTALTDAEYRKKKSRVTDVLRRRLQTRIPQLSDATEQAGLATPKTIQRYTLNPGGTADGFAQTPSQSLFDRQVESPLPNLLFASAWAFPGGGLTGAIMSGYLTAEAVLAGEATT